jgi:hypothetical protein
MYLQWHVLQTLTTHDDSPHGAGVVGVLQHQLHLGVALRRGTSQLPVNIARKAVQLHRAWPELQRINTQRKSGAGSEGWLDWVAALKGSVLRHQC